MLALLDRVPGIRRSHTNYSGRLIRLTLAPGAEHDAVAERAAEVLRAEDRHAVPLSPQDAAAALAAESWRDAGQAWELSEIEYRTLTSRHLEEFAAETRLDDRAAPFLRIGEEEWQRLAQVRPEKPEEQAEEDYWLDRCIAFARAVLARSGEVLTDEERAALEAFILDRLPAD